MTRIHFLIKFHFEHNATNASALRCQSTYHLINRNRHYSVCFVETNYFLTNRDTLSIKMILNLFYSVFFTKINVILYNLKMSHQNVLAALTTKIGTNSVKAINFFSNPSDKYSFLSFSSS